MYKDQYHPKGVEWAWYSSPITVDKRTNRKAIYYLGEKDLIEVLKTKKNEDGSADLPFIMGQVDNLPLLFTFNGRNNVLDVYRSDGILEEIPYPYPVHVEVFTAAVARLLKYEEPVAPPTPDLWNKIDGVAVASGRDSLGDSLSTKYTGELNGEEAKPSKYTDELVRESANKAFNKSKTFKKRSKIDRNSVDLTKLLPDYIVTKKSPKEQLGDTEEFVNMLSQMAHIEAKNTNESLPKPRVLGIIGLISNLLDKMGGKNGQ